MTVRPGDLAFVKNSGESVFVKEIRKTGGQWDCNPSRLTAVVDKPVATREVGIQHADAIFFVEELETAEEKLLREYSDMSRARDMMQKIADANVAKEEETVEVLPA